MPVPLVPYLHLHLVQKQELWLFKGDCGEPCLRLAVGPSA